MTAPIDVVIPTFNRWELTKKCLELLRVQTVAHTVIVADNASTDGTPERVRAAFGEVRVIELDRNRGFSVACNAGAREGTADVLVLLNNDVHCPPNFLERLTARLHADRKAGSVAGLLLLDDTETVESFGVTVDRTLAGYPRFRGEPRARAQAGGAVLAGPSGAAAAFRREAWDGVGGLDEAVFAYGEDVDLALRLRGVGWSSVAAPDAVAIHHGSATAVHRSQAQRYAGGFSRGYFVRRYGVLRGRAAIRTLATEAIAVTGDALVYSRDLAALRGRLAGWRAARGLPEHCAPPDDAIDEGISFAESLRLRRATYRCT
jgi:N-acetylglucosaminyl-diphospho-decaprenol L-rhamnosyltransferase